MKLKKIDLTAGILIMIIWGANFSVIGLGLQSLDPFLLTLLRFIFCAFPLVFFIKKPKNISYPTLALYGVLFGAGMGGGLNIAMHNGLSAGVSSVLLQFSAFFTIILCRLFLKEKGTVFHVLGGAFASAGLFTFISISAEDSTTIGILIILIAAFCWSLCNLIIKVKKPDNMISFIVWSSLFSTPVLFIITLIAKGTQPFDNFYSDITWSASLSIVFQCYITTLFGYMTWNNLMKKYPTSVIAPLSLIVPIAGILTSYIFLDEQLSIHQGLATLSIFIGIFIFINSENFQKSFHQTKKAPSDT